jgi:hypothetical protein
MEINQEAKSVRISPQRLVAVVAILVGAALVVGLLGGTVIGWALNGRAHQPLMRNLAESGVAMETATATLNAVSAERDQYRAQAQAASNTIRVVYRGSLQETATDAGPESAWVEIELTQDRPSSDGTIYLEDLGEIAEYAKHDKAIDSSLMALIVNQFGSTEESGPGR